jgi:hypothetical protein
LQDLIEPALLEPPDKVSLFPFENLVEQAVDAGLLSCIVVVNHLHIPDLRLRHVNYFLLECFVLFFECTDILDEFLDPCLLGSCLGFAELHLTHRVLVKRV